MTDDEIRRLAELARLRLEPEAIAPLREQLDRIVGYIDRLATVDVSGVEPFVGPRDRDAVVDGGVDGGDGEGLRADEPGDALGVELALRSSPRHDGEHVLVPRFVDEG